MATTRPSILISYEYSLTKKERFPKGGNTDVTIFYYMAGTGSNLHLTNEIDVGNHLFRKDPSLPGAPRHPMVARRILRLKNRNPSSELGTPNSPYWLHPI
jgi:hypothetical protein